jgi:urocanate hydratase
MKRSFSVTTGPGLRCKGWRQEGLLRLLENVLAVGVDPDNLVVYAALGRAARDWPSYDAIVATLKTMKEGQTLIVQSGKPIGVIRTHAKAPLVLMANCNLVGQWAKAETFYELEKKNLICWGGLTAGDWQYIGSQGVIQGTYEIFMRIAERHFGGDRAAPSCSPRGSVNGRRAAARRHHGQRRHPVHRGRSRPHRKAHRYRISGHTSANARRRTRHDQGGPRRARCALCGLCGNAAEIYPRSWRAASCPTSSPIRPPRTT